MSNAREKSLLSLYSSCRRLALSCLSDYFLWSNKSNINQRSSWWRRLALLRLTQSRSSKDAHTKSHNSRSGKSDDFRSHWRQSDFKSHCQKWWLAPKKMTFDFDQSLWKALPYLLIFRGQTSAPQKSWLLKSLAHMTKCRWPSADGMKTEKGRENLRAHFARSLRHYLGANQLRDIFFKLFEWVMSRIWVLHVTPMIETCPHIWKNNLTDVNESWCPSTTSKINSTECFYSGREIYTDMEI